MIIERFIIYQFDNVFYTKEELEDLGFVYMETKESYSNLEKNANYEITEKSYFSESTYSLEECLTCDEKLIEGKFLFDFGEKGLILDVKKYYGLRCENKGTNKGELIQLFTDKQDCDKAYEKIERGINQNFEEFAKIESPSNVANSKELVRQEAEKKTRQYVLSLLNKEK